MALTKVAVVQAGAYVFDTARSLEKALGMIGATPGAELIVFPEAFLGGYPKGTDFGARVGMRSAEGRRWFRKYFEGAVDVPGPETEAVAEAAKAAGAWVVIGVIERGGGTLYCTALMFSPEGKLAGKHRKLMPTAMERIIWGFGDGSTMPVLETGIGRLGAVICWENYMPALRMAMYQKGIQLYCAPTVDDREIWAASMRHIAYEGRCFVMSACQFTTGTEYPDAVGIRGGSLIVGPLGQVLAGPVYGEECVLRAELDLGEIAEAKYDLDVAGHYARPDVFQLKVNEG
jgi:nitrilase